MAGKLGGKNNKRVTASKLPRHELGDIVKQAAQHCNGGAAVGHENNLAIDSVRPSQPTILGRDEQEWMEGRVRRTSAVD